MTSSCTRSVATRVGRALTLPRLLAFAVLGLLTVTGAAPAVRSTELTASRAPSARPVPEQAYLQATRLHGVPGSDEAVLGMARNACAELTSGGDPRRVTGDVARRGELGATGAHAVLRAAVHAYCPAHGD